jgi:uncharacterized membrane protein HdeD (DUF308 family)
MATTSLERHTHNWGVPMTIGILLILIGLFALYATVETSLISVLFLGGILIAVGILEIFSSFRLRKAGPFLAYLLAGLLTLVVGALFLDRPLAGLGAVTLLVAGYLFAIGLFRIITSVMDRYHGWGWELAYGILAVALGAYVVATWPVAKFWVLGTIVAIEIIARGIAMIAASLALRDVEHGTLPHGLAA